MCRNLVNENYKVESIFNKIHANFYDIGMKNASGHVSRAVFDIIALLGIVTSTHGEQLLVPFRLTLSRPITAFIAVICL